MLGLTKKTDYALLALSHLAQEEEGRAVRAKEIAEQYDIPVELLAKIMQKLARARMLGSAPGPTGGYCLMRAPHEISIAAVVEAVEGRPAIAQCMKDTQNGCEQLEKCTIRAPLERVNLRVYQLLNRISLAEIIDPEPSESAPRQHSLPFIDRKSAPLVR
jgi:Rrf2 family protein